MNNLLDIDNFLNELFDYTYFFKFINESEDYIVEGRDDEETRYSGRHIPSRCSIGQINSLSGREQEADTSKGQKNV